MQTTPSHATRASSVVRAPRTTRCVDGRRHHLWARFSLPHLGDALERARQSVARDMAVDAVEAAAHAHAVVTVFHFIAYSCAGVAFGFAVFVNLYVLVALDDLQSDFVNPHDATRKINRLIAWEIASHACGCAFMLVSGHWVMVLANGPLAYYHYVGCVESNARHRRRRRIILSFSRRERFVVRTND